MLYCWRSEVVAWRVPFPDRGRPRGLSGYRREGRPKSRGEWPRKGPPALSDRHSTNPFNLVCRLGRPLACRFARYGASNYFVKPFVMVCA
jgi:hypothetical protein